MLKLVSSRGKSVGRLAKIQSYSTAESINQQRNTIDHTDVEHHTKLSKIWWDINGQLGPLHAFNRLRVKLVRNEFEDIKQQNPTQPLLGKKILDVGCGGGILSEPLARIGGNVTGLDASEELITLAKEHAKLDSSLSGRLSYINTSVEEFAKDNPSTHDAIVASEIIEHVTDQDLFLKSCADILKPGGSIFITTFNKTLPAWLGGIVLTEYILQSIPIGTHDWNKFISPAETEFLLEKYKCKTKAVYGTFFNPLKREWSWTESKQFHYALHARKVQD